MPFFKLKSLALVAVAAFVFFTTTGAVRPFNRRSDLDNIQPVSKSGYTVPLQAGVICHSAGDCIDTLPAPASNKILKALTVAQGVMEYDCTDAGPNDAPTFVAQNTELYDAAPLIPFLPNEDSLHDFPCMFATYNYAKVQNSSLVCIGHIYTQEGATTIDLVDRDTFVVHVDVAIPAPADVDFNGYWAHSTTTDKAWDVYRVETCGGAVPLSCRNQNNTIFLDYTAEYWFYHA